jgi:glycolate oxidase
MTLTMPKAEEAILAKRAEIVARLEKIVAPGHVLSDDRRMRPYECDAVTMYRQLPLVVVLPETVAEVSAIMALAKELNVKVVPRGGGTSLSGGSMPLEDGILLAMGKFNKILEVDYENRCAVVQPGVANLAITKAVEDRGFYYAPDPSSQIACSIGGNVGENSGGVHSLKYGLTTNNILGLEIVLMGGEVIRLGGKHLDSELYDLIGIMTGSEGLLGVITEVTVRILKKPEVARGLLLGFPTVEAGCDCVAAIIAAGIIPGGMEMMDNPCIVAVQKFQPCGYPTDAASLVIVELDGTASEVDHLIDQVSKIAGAQGASTIRVSTSDAERAQFWQGRKNAFPAAGAMGPDYLCMDGTIPRKQLSHVLKRMDELAAKHELRVSNVFHAGDGNLHPLILYDGSKPGDIERAEAFGADILRLCVEVGGVLTGEHGVGVEKRDLMGTMFSEIDLQQQQRLKCAFDPEHRLNPGKVFPTLHRCAELGKMHVHAGKVAFPDLPRF